MRQRSNTPQDYHKEFVQSAIDNATQMITLVDAKVGVLIALYGLIIAGIIEVRGEIANSLISTYENCMCLFVVLVSVISVSFLFLCVSIIFAIKTVMPTINPSENIIHRNFADKQMWYVLLSSDKNHLEYSLDDYHRKLLMKNEQFCIKCLEYEMLKLSYIRNVKNNSFKISFKCFSCFLISLLVTSISVIIINMC